MITTNRKFFCWQEPEIIAHALINTWGNAGFIWLDGDGSKTGELVTLGVNPIEQICCRGLPGQPNASNPFEALRHLKPGHWTGWLSYEAAAWTEPNNPWKADDMSMLWIASHDPVIKFKVDRECPDSATQYFILKCRGLKKLIHSADRALVIPH